MASMPFKVKAVYEYNSPHDEDLSFPNGQVITVTEEEDADWYVGEYTDSSGNKKDGLFPKNFVEKFEPEAPPRPTRTRPRKEAPPTEPEPDVTARAIRDPAETIETSAVPLQVPVKGQEEAHGSASQSHSVERTVEPRPEAESQKPAAPSKPPAPPVTEKPSSFKDRIAAFNKGGQAPLAPVKPAAPSAGTGFIKKPFVAPPPARDSYVPPPRKEPPTKVYRREEDPDIAEQRAQDAELAERAGIASADTPVEGEEAAKTTSLKDRIALLKKQQQEQAERRAEASTEKPKKSTKKRNEDSEEPPVSVEEGTVGLVESPEPPARQSTDSSRELPKPPMVRKSSKDPRAPELPSRDMLSSDNDADQSGAGDTTEDAGGESTEVEDIEDSTKIMPATRTSTEGSVRTAHATNIEDREAVASNEEAENNNDVDEEVEEEEDPEVKRKRELRERMAKMSGGMGMGNLFGPPGGMPVAGPKKSKVAPSTAAEDTSPPPPQRIPVMPMPGLQKMDGRDEEETVVEKEPEPSLPIAAERPPEQVPDVEDLEPRPTEASERTAAPPVPKERPVPQAPSVPPRGAAPPIPGSRQVPPPLQARPVPPPPRAEQVTPDSGSDEEEPEPSSYPSAKDLPTRAPPPPVPQGPRSPPVPPRRSTDLMEAASSTATSPSSPQQRRMPPIPGASPMIPPPTEFRPPPPPPPAAAPPTRQSAQNEAPDADDEEAEDDYPYEGDYDTDIAPTASRKDALKHVREPSFDETTLSEDTSTTPRDAPPPPPGSRAAPPPPPHQAPKINRESAEIPRAPPPAPPIREPLGSPGDEDYDPYRYDSASPAPGHLLQASEPALYNSAASSTSTTRAVPPPPPSSPPTQKYSVPPPPPPQHQTLPPPADPRSSRDAPRKSAETSRQSLNAPRRSVEQSRPSGDSGGQIAQDVDLGESTLWWAQPEAPPPVFQNRADVLYESEESSTSKRGGRTTVSKDVYVLFQDYSQTIVTARFDAKNPSDVSLEQRHEPPPPRPRQEQLEAVYGQYGAAVAQNIESMQHNTVGDGSAHSFVVQLILGLKSALMPVGTRAYGALVYSNMANASVSQHDEIRPGDIVSFRNAKFQGKAGTLHKPYTLEVGKPDHVAVVKEWDGTKKKIRALDQGREKDKKGVREESFRVGDLRSGEVKVWRIVGRSYVGWEG